MIFCLLVIQYLDDGRGTQRYIHGDFQCPAIHRNFGGSRQRMMQSVFAVQLGHIESLLLLRECHPCHPINPRSNAANKHQFNKNPM